MHIVVESVLFFFLANAGLGQPYSGESVSEVRISKLAIESSSLPDADRERIVRLFQQKTYFQDEIGERIRGALRDLGYYKAVVNEPRFSFPTQAEGRRIANVTVKVEPGAQYRVAEIRFQKATVFPATQRRTLFQVRKGDLFNVAKIVEGLEDMRKLYGTRGYVNLVAIPQVMIDESRRTIDMVFDVDEGKPYDFGRLYLEGVEPYAGAGKVLLNSWKPLEGKRYNSLELEHWFLANQSSWNVKAPMYRSITTTQRPVCCVVDLTLSQWDP
ncbi:POTRA domain-containing protein [Edaphobacter aggregans]|uniref:POTRA domain-containing protein n=1 Tax=Edaphobacter aggregans TaxID=570835 RepID=UPI000555FA61|nr:POTRA domain-containing protein [Edaphobacter aggregans]